MILTRHLYRFDEVLAACMYNLTNGRTRDAVFWTIELIQSGHVADALYCLFYTWAFTIGPLRLEWARRAWEIFHHDEIDETVIIQYAAALTAAIASKPSIGKEATEDTTYSNTKDCTAILLLLSYNSNSNNKESMLQKEYKAAAEGGWKGLEGRAGGDARLRQLFAGFQRIEKCLGDEYAGRLHRILFAVGFLSFKLKNEQKEKSWKPLLLRDCDAEWKEWLIADTGVRRGRRVLEIPYMCLYGMTARGDISQKETTLKEIRFDIESVFREGGWWAERLHEYGDLEDDTERERFYDTEFPEDIPDEWSLSDQQKSHGGGAAVLAGARANPARVLERWYPMERSSWWSNSDARNIWKSVRELEGLERRLGISI